MLGIERSDEDGITWISTPNVGELGKLPMRNILSVFVLLDNAKIGVFTSVRARQVIAFFLHKKKSRTKHDKTS
jgi:hypothetical protein